jgi:hypothetical protein
MSQDQAPRNIVFDRYRIPDDAASIKDVLAGRAKHADLYSDALVVRIEQAEYDHADDRTEAQRTAIPENLKSALDGSLFGTSADWAYQGYIVHPLPAPGTADLLRLLNDRPQQPSDAESRRAALDSIKPADLDTATAPQPDGTPRPADLVLFNVLVALEWQPHDEDLRQLEWAFRRASDLLYDITDGSMAFGQVIFGGPELMKCADIQVMASNRLLARSWVGGLREEQKYMPIRMGRGVWHSVNLVTIPWNEPEGYRMLIHEWGHYALYLRDAYLDKVQLAFAGAAGLAHMPGQALVRAKAGEAAPYTVAVPKISRASESIMETLEGTSELVARTDRSPGQDYEWKVILKHYPMLRQKQRLFEGPGRLPLPLPLFVRHPEIGTGQQLCLQARAYMPAEEIEPDRCWLYVVKNIDSENPRLIAQGTLDARSLYQPFPLLGAEPGDTLVLIGRGYDRRPVVKRGEIAVEAGSSQITIPRWRAATPSVFPVIEVLPEPAGVDEKVAQVRVRLNSAGGPPPEQVWVFPLGLPDPAISLYPDRPIWTSDEQPVATLDGHVLARWGDQVAICTFSQGGNPGSGSPNAPPPISPGSSDGTVLLFFYDDTAVEDISDVKRDKVAADYYSRVKMITTILHGVHGVLPSGARPRSQVCSITSNAPLPLHLRPTLIMYYDSRDERDPLTGDLLICRLENGVWTPLPTYLPPGRPFAVAPLDDGTAGSLSPYRGEPRAEFFMVCWVPCGV